MAKIPKPGESWTLSSGIGAADLRIVDVCWTTQMGEYPEVTIKAIAVESHMGTEVSGGGYARQSPTWTNTNTISFAPGDIYASVDTGKTYKFNKVGFEKGMAVEIKIVETVDGTVAQIVLTVGTKRVICWQSEAYEDVVEGDKTTTASELAQKSAEAHAKDVLKRLFA